MNRVVPIAALVLALGLVGYRFVLPRVWSVPAAEPIVLEHDPLQTALAQPDEVTVQRDHRSYLFQKQFAFDLSGEVLSASSYDVTWTNDFFDVDVGVIWGPEREAMKSRYHFFQMGRWLFWRSSEQVSTEERLNITRHIANLHLIPNETSTHLGRAFRFVKAGDHVRIKGALVRITGPGGQLLAQSSISRDDTGDGACEVVWVDELQIGSRIFR